MGSKMDRPMKGALFGLAIDWMSSAGPLNRLASGFVEFAVGAGFP